MKLRKFFVFVFKKNLLTTLFTLFLIFLVIFSNTNLFAAKNGLTLWAKNVIPSLFPFFVATELLNYTNLPYYLGKLTNKFMRPLFNAPGESSYAFIMGIISGYPVGAKIATEFRKNNILPKEECERLLSFTNNSGPLFIIGTVGISMFGNSSIGFLLFITHIFACLTVGFIFRYWKRNSHNNETYANSQISNKNNITFSNLGAVIAESIANSISTILTIGGFIVLFSVIISIFKVSHALNICTTIFNPVFSFFNIPDDFISPALIGFLEITNGISLISLINIKKISVNIIFTAFFLGIGGLSILLQVYSIVSKSDLSIKPYIIGKLLHGVLAAFYTFIIISVFPVFNFNL